MTRQDYNISIANYILNHCKSSENKDQRFHQLLFNLNINEFSDQSKKDIQEIRHPNDIVNVTFKDKYQEESKITFDNLMKQ